MRKVVDVGRAAAGAQGSLNSVFLVHGLPEEVDAEEREDVRLQQRDEGLDHVDWPDSTKRLQKNWIGKSEGAEVTFKLDGHADTLTVFTTRPDTLYGATYMVIAPEHPLIGKLTTAAQKDAVESYVAAVRNKTDLESTDLADKKKTGVLTGAYAINPVNGAKIPVCTADYVLITYGTGAIMAVPAHDERDWEFAK